MSERLDYSAAYAEAVREIAQLEQNVRDARAECDALRARAEATRGPCFFSGGRAPMNECKV